MKEIVMKYRLIITAVLLALFVVACGSTEEPTPEPPPIEAPAEEPTAVVETPTATAEPTNTPEPTATPEPTPDPAAELSGLAADFVPYESAFSGITLAHPPDWVFMDFFFTIFASDADLLASAMDEDDLPDDLDGNVFGFLLGVPLDEVEDSSPEAIMDEFMADFDVTDDEVEIVEGPVEMTFNGQPGLYVVAVGEEDGTELALLYLAVINEELGYMAVMLAVTSPSSIDQFKPQLLAIANTIEMSEPDMDSLFDFDFDLDQDAFETDLDLSEPGHRLYLTDTLAEAEEHHYQFVATDLGTITAVVTPLDGLDVVLEIYDEEEELLLQVDESFGVETVTFTGPEALGYYTLVVRGYAEQGGDYIIDLETNSGVTLFLIDGDEVISLLGEAARLEYAVILNEGEQLTAVALPEADLDIVLEIYDIDEELLLDVDNGFSGESETLVFTAPADGVYFLVARGFAGSIGQYALSVEIR
jgi:hypothetical protein